MVTGKQLDAIFDKAPNYIAGGALLLLVAGTGISVYGIVTQGKEELLNIPSKSFLLGKGTKEEIELHVGAGICDMDARGNYGFTTVETSRLKKCSSEEQILQKLSWQGMPEWGLGASQKLGAITSGMVGYKNFEEFCRNAQTYAVNAVYNKL